MSVDLDLQDVANGLNTDVEAIRASGIYLIRNKVNNHCYVGSSSRMLVRARQHLVALTRGEHHCEPLQRAFTKYGVTSFVFCLVEEAEGRNALLTAEQRWIDAKGYYNTAKLAGSPAGIKLRLSTEERCRRRERARKLNANRSAAETAANTRKAQAARLVNQVSDETKRKISDSLKGRTFSDEHLRKIHDAKMSNPEFLVKSLESARRLNESRCNMTPEQAAAWKAKISAARKGKKLSEDHKARIKAGMQRAYQPTGESHG